MGFDGSRKDGHVYKVLSPLYYLSPLICIPQVNGVKNRFLFFFIFSFGISIQGSPHADRCKKNMRSVVLKRVVVCVPFELMIRSPIMKVLI